MKKRMLAMLIVFSICLILLPGWTLAGPKTSRDGLWRFDRLSKTIIRYYGNEESVTIPRIIDGCSMEIIGSDAFSWCASLKHVDLGDYIKTIEAGAFANCTNLESITSGRTVAVGDEAFQNCTSLKTVDLKIGYKEIGCRAFQNCTSLKSFTIPDGITTLHNEAFKGCTGLKTIVINDDVKTWGAGVFAGCTGLDGIWAEEGSIRYSNDEKGVLFTKDKSWLLAAPGSLSGTYVIPETVTKILSYAFAGCSKLETILIHDNVTDPGNGTFQNCTALKTVVHSGYRTPMGRQFQGCTALETVVTFGFCGPEAFADCTSLRSIYCYQARTDHAPNAFMNVTANMYYAKGTTTLSPQELQPYQFKGNITWIPLDGYCVAVGDRSTYVLGSDVGAIFLIMAPLEQLVSVSVDGRVLTKEQYIPMTKGTVVILPDDYLKTLSLGKHDLKVVYTDGSCNAIFILSDKPGCEHQLVVQDAKAPTCTESGLTQGVFCEKCQTVFAEQKPVEEWGHENNVTTVPPTCTEAGYDRHVCIYCRAEERHNVVSALGHSFGQWETVKPPTVEETGLSQRVCVVCGEIQQQELEKLTPPPTEPKPTDPKPTEPKATEPKPTEPKPTEPKPMQPTEPSGTAPTEAEPGLQEPEEPVNLVPVIILGAVLLVATAASILYLFRKKS